MHAFQKPRPLPPIEGDTPFGQPALGFCGCQVWALYLKQHGHRPHR